MALTIPAAWSPSPGCLASTDLWEWQRDVTKAPILGGPVETSSCYPPGYTGETRIYYEATACPTGFFPACGHIDLRTTCCPTGYDFVCNTESAYGFIGVTTFLCKSIWTADDTIALTYTQLGQMGDYVPSYTVTRTSDSSTTAFATSGTFETTVVVKSGSTLFAMAVAITPPVNTPAPAAGGLSTGAAAGIGVGAAAGIGVGAAVGALILAAAAFFVYRHRRRRRQPPPTAGQSSQYAGVPQFGDVHRKPGLAQPVEMGVYERPRELPT